MHSARQSFLSYYSFSNTRKRKGDGSGQLRQSRKAGGTVAGRFPVVGGHGKQGFQLGGGHGDNTCTSRSSMARKPGYSTCCTGFL